MFQPGDVVRFLSPSAGKTKYHLCVCSSVDDGRYQFLFINSKPGYPDELVYDDGVIGSLPKSATGKTVISFGMLVRMSEKQLSLFRAAKISEISLEIATDVISFADSAATLTRREQQMIIDGLSTIFPK